MPFNRRRIDDSLLLIVGFVFLLLFTRPWAVSWSEASRLATVEALADRGTAVLDGGSMPGHGDRVLTEHGFVSHQPPGAALLLVPPYMALRLAGLHLATNPEAVARILSIVLCGMSWLLTGWLLHRRHRANGLEIRWSALAVGGLLFGSLALPYALALNGHLPAGTLLLFAFLLLVGEPQRGDFLLAGLFMGAAFSFDHASIFLIAPALLSRFLTRSEGALPTLLALLPGILIPLFWYQSFGGSYLPLSLRTDLFDYPWSPFLLMRATGGIQFDGMFAYLGALLFGEHGLLSNHPILLFPLAGLVVEARAGGWAERVVLLGTVGIVLFYALTSRNLGGQCFGIRWFALFLPALGFGLLKTAVWIRNSVGLRALFLVLLLPSLLFAGIGAMQPWAKLYLRDPVAAHPGASFPEHMALEIERRNSAKPSFSRTEFQAFYRSNIARFLEQTRRRAAAARTPAARRLILDEAAATLDAMLVSTQDCAELSRAREALSSF